VRVAELARQRRQHETLQTRGGETWEAWWQAIAARPETKELYEERQRRFAQSSHGKQAPIFDVHVAGLRDAGFSEVATIWQNMDNRVLMAVK